MVILPNIDGKIWHIEQKIIELIHQYNTDQKLTISMNQEGPCLQSLGLFDLLDNLCERFHWDKNCIEIFTNNLLESHSEYRIKKLAPLHLLSSAQKFCKSNSLKEKDFTSLKHFGIFIGRSNWLRLWLSSLIYSKYNDITIQTFHYDPSVDYHRENLGIDSLLSSLNNDQLELSHVVNLLEKSPILIDQCLPEYPILTPAHYEISKVYHRFFVEIVCETYSQGTTFYPTEKIWRPIACKTPFIVQGPANYYHNLRKIGFKTFNQWWDEGFTEDNYTHQPREIIKILDSLSRLTRSQLKNMYTEMAPILEHNYQLLQELSANNIVRMF
jgi:hypothetical protein